MTEGEGDPLCAWLLLQLGKHPFRRVDTVHRDTVSASGNARRPVPAANSTAGPSEAETAIAVLDGLLLLRQLAGPAAANRAARRLGIR